MFYDGIDEIEVPETAEELMLEMALFDGLNDRERLVVEKKMEGYSRDEIADMLRVSGPRITQIVKV